MSRYADAFETLAERSPAAGATLLLERVHATAAEAPDRPPSSKRWRGPATAVAAFAAVLAVGLIWNLVLAPSSDVADHQDIDWIEVEDRSLRFIQSGPGGFIRAPHFFLPDQVGLEFSSDGHSWTPIPVFAESQILEPGRGFIRGLTTSSDAWLLTIETDDDHINGWTSADGTSWQATEWDDSFQATLVELVGIPDGFIATTSDPFDSGWGYWTSPDGQMWDRRDDIAPSNVSLANITSTAGPAMWLPFREDRDAPLVFYSSRDGREWTQSIINLPAEYAAQRHLWGLEAIEYMGGQWIVIASVLRQDINPTLLTFTSRDGVNWTSQGIPGLDGREDRATSVNEAAVIDGRLFVAPSTTPIEDGDTGFRRPGGATDSTGEVWATSDGSTWSMVLLTPREIRDIAGRVRSDGTTIGIYVTYQEGSPDQQVVETTTAPTAAPQALDPAGLELQRSILQDGVVTREELEAAWQGWQACMESRGLIAVSFDIDQRGDVSSEYGSRDPNAGEAEDTACRQSYLREVSDAFSIQRSSG